MSARLTFPRGGIFPREMKNDTAARPIWNASLPALSVVPLHQHVGAPAECLVGPGDEVREGMLIGRANGFVSAQVHAPVPGTVREIREIYLPAGIKSQAVVIELGGEFDRLGKPNKAVDWRLLSRERLLSTIADCGVVGMGGGAFPTHVKFTLPKGKRIEFLILNGAESEPYLSADHRLLTEHAENLCEGLDIAAAMLKPDRIVVAIEENKPDAIDAFTKAVSRTRSTAEVRVLRVKYPQGDEKQLVRAITGKEVPSGGLPLDVGCIVSNAATVFAVFEAVAHGKPLIERVLTIAGGAVAAPANVKARIGTPFADLLLECGGLKEVPQKIVAGGPMLGFAVHNLSTPVTKATSAILCLTSREVRESRRTACIGCGRCIQSCPMGLHPSRLFKLIDHGRYAQAGAEGVFDCSECGCCGYICPANIPLVQAMRVGKRLADTGRAADG